MEFKGTKGKWEVLPDNEHREICQIWTEKEPNRLPVYIARTCFAPASKANAQLIATAPEMLNLLNEFIELGNNCDWRPEDELNELYVKAMDIINKSLGKEADNE